MYYIEGFVKKFPLDKSEVTIGWNECNDLSINNELISGYHLKIDVGTDFIKITDLDSTNGTYYSGEKVKRSVIKLGESFFAGSIEFILKKGNLEEFKTSKELIPIFDKIRKENETRIRNRKTKYIKNVYEEVLTQILKVGIKRVSVSGLFFEVSNYLTNLPEFGSIFIVSNTAEGFNFHMSLKSRELDYNSIEQIIDSNPEVFDVKIKFRNILDCKDHFYSFPFRLTNKRATLIFIPDKKKKADKKVLDFLLILTKEIELISKIINEKGT